MENLKLTSMQIIANVGSSRSKFMESISSAKKGDYDEAIKLHKEASELFNKAHKIHSELLTKMANNEKIDIDLLLIHAEDQLMSTEMFRILSNEFIEIYKKINN